MKLDAEKPVSIANTGPSSLSQPLMSQTSSEPKNSVRIISNLFVNAMF